MLFFVHPATYASILSLEMSNRSKNVDKSSSRTCSGDVDFASLDMVKIQNWVAVIVISQQREVSRPSPLSQFRECHFKPFEQASRSPYFHAKKKCFATTPTLVFYCCRALPHIPATFLVNLDYSLHKQSPFTLGIIDTK